MINFESRSDGGPNQVGPFDDEAAAQRHVDKLDLDADYWGIVPLTKPADDRPRSDGPFLIRYEIDGAPAAFGPYFHICDAVDDIAGLDSAGIPYEITTAATGPDTAPPDHTAAVRALPANHVSLTVRPSGDLPTLPSSDTDITASPVLRGRHHPSDASPTGHMSWCMATTPTGEHLPLTGAALHHVCRQPDGHFLTRHHLCDVCGHTWPSGDELAPPDTNHMVVQALTEYGNAIQGDWGGLDGRTVNRHLGSLAALLRTPPDQPPTIQHLRTELEICPDGGGHWTEHCQDTCDIPTTQPKLGETQACTIADIHTPHDDCNGRIFGMRPPAGVPDPTTIPTKLD